MDTAAAGGSTDAAGERVSHCAQQRGLERTHDRRLLPRRCDGAARHEGPIPRSPGIDLQPGAGAHVAGLLIENPAQRDSVSCQRGGVEQRSLG